MTESLKDIFDEAVSLSTQSEDNFVKLGKLLRKLQVEDKELFKQLIEENGLDRRKAYYFAAIARQFTGLPINKEKLAAIGWTKAEIIGPHVTRNNWRELLELARKYSAHDLRIAVNGGTPVRGMRSVLLRLKPRQYDRFAKAVAAFGGKVDGATLKNKERALMNLIDAAEQAAAS